MNIIRLGENIKYKIRKSCKEVGCNNKIHAKGLCSKHYQRERKRILSGSSCCIENCNNKRSYSDGRCTKHHYQIKEGKPCKVEKCNCTHYAKGMCYTHYNKEVYKNKKLTSAVIENNIVVDLDYIKEEYPSKTTLKSYIREKLLGGASRAFSNFKSIFNK